MDLKERALLGIPIDTPFGQLKPLSVYEFLEYGDALAAITFDVSRVLHELRLNQDEEVRETKELTEELRQLKEKYSLKDILIAYMQHFFYAYVEIVSRCKVIEDGTDLETIRETTFNELSELSPEEFDSLRKIILEINNQSSQTASLDPTVQKWKEKALKFKHSSKKDSAPNVSTMVTTIVAYSGHTFKEVTSWNITQLLQTFQRIGLLKAYDTTTLFATVTDKIDIQSWSENIEVEDDSNTSKDVALSYSDFKQNVGDAVQ